ncbi:MAG: HAD family hydrolase [Phycisphaerales bacterium]
MHAAGGAAAVLIFFDIDATLITTSRSGVQAMEDAGRELFAPAFSVDGVEFAGRLDPLILVDLLRANGVEPTAAAVARFRDGYRRRLSHRLEDRSKCRALPGVMDLLGALRQGHTNSPARPHLALLTGNFADTGSAKLRACGIEPDWFSVRVWGDDSPHPVPCRDHLPGVGLERYAALTGRHLAGAEAVVIGDTPHDVACARAHGCRSLAVGTGSFSVEELRRAGADWAVPDLSDTRAVLEWLVGGGSGGSAQRR